jgi:hypothetical protein
LRRVWPAALVCGGSFAAVQFSVSNFIGPYLTDILGSLAAVVSVVALLRVWHPGERSRAEKPHTTREILFAWSPVGPQAFGVFAAAGDLWTNRNPLFTTPSRNLAIRVSAF